MKIFYENNYLNYALSIIFEILFALISIATALVTQQMVDLAYLGTMEQYKEILVITVAVLLSRIIIQWLKMKAVNKYVYTAVKQFKDFIFNKVMEKNIDSFESEDMSDYLSAFSNDINQIEQNYINGNLAIVLQSCLLFGSIAAMAYLNIYMCILTVVLSILPMAVSILYGKNISSVEQKVSKENSSFISSLKDILTGFAIIKNFNASKEIIGLFSNKNAHLEQTKKERLDANRTLEILCDISACAMNLSVFALGLYLAITKRTSAGTIVAYLQLLGFILNPISVLGYVIPNRNAAKGLITKIYNSATSKIDTASKMMLNDTPDFVRYENVSFGYKADVSNLSDINLTFEKGKSYAIVGASGSGKSTLLKLMLGYFENYTGNIYYGDKELREISKEAVYNVVSVIQQNVFVFDRTIEENITLFKEFDKDNIEKVIDMSELRNLVNEKGMDYRCGENGSNLSGGEKQRIAIARSLIRGNPILLMDEATSSLDATTTNMIETSILNIKNITRIIVTHKLNENILRKYDGIIVLSKGKVVEMGDYDTLLSKKEYLYSLMLLQ